MLITGSAVLSSVREMRLPEGRRPQLGQEIKRLRRVRRWTQEQLEERSGVGQSTISALENGKQDQTSGEYLRRLADAFDVSVNVLLEAAGIMDEGATETPRRASTPLYAPMPITVPVYDQPVSAGKGEPAIQQYLYFSPDSGIPPGWYGLPVIGSCMVPHLFEGDVVVVDPEGHADPGDMIVCEIDQEQALVKWFTKHRGQLFIEPERGDMVPFDESRMRIIGVVMKMWRDIRKKPRKEILRAAQE